MIGIAAKLMIDTRSKANSLSELTTAELQNALIASGFPVTAIDADLINYVAE